MQQSSILITIDVEEDMPGWIVPPRVSVKNVNALPRLQAMCDRLEVRPTYLVTYPMATVPEAIKVLGELLDTGRCEIGAHLHPWNTPPLPNGPERVARRATELPRRLVSDKLKVLTEAIHTAFGIQPTSFRYGRFGIDGPGLQALEDAGYLVDSSVTSGISWAEEGGVDFRFAPTRPYFPNRWDPARTGGSSVLEVPVSVGFTRRVPWWVREVYLRLPRWTRVRGLLSRDFTDLLELLWLSPWGHTAARLCRVADTLLDEGATFLNVFLHSSELRPGASAYAVSEEDVDWYYRTLEKLLSHMVEIGGCRGRTLTEFRKSYLELSRLRLVAGR